MLPCGYCVFHVDWNCRDSGLQGKVTVWQERPTNNKMSFCDKGLQLFNQVADNFYLEASFPIVTAPATAGIQNK